MLAIYFKIGMVLAIIILFAELVIMERGEMSFDDFYKGMLYLTEDTIFEKIVKTSIAKRICFICTVLWDSVRLIVLWPIVIICTILLLWIMFKD